jgi:hypothetical protein
MVVRIQVWTAAYGLKMRCTMMAGGHSVYYDESCIYESSAIFQERCEVLSKLLQPNSVVSPGS